MSFFLLPHLPTGWHVDQAIVTEEERLVIIRFGRDWDRKGLGFLSCLVQDHFLYKIAERVKNMAVIYLCDIDRVPDFNKM